MNVIHSIEALTSQPIIQQDLKRCRIRATPACTSTVFFFIAILYVWLFCFYGLAQRYTKEYEFRYDEFCKNSTICVFPFTIDTQLTQPIGLFYKLTDFKQTDRGIAESYSSEMLQGKEIKDYNSCEPHIYLSDQVHQNNLYIPCGLLPAAVFNDTLSLLEFDKFNESDIVLEVDQSTLFHISNPKYNSSVHWLESTGLFNNGQIDPHFIVWMRKSAFSPFRKLYAISREDLKPGKYHLSIHNNYPTSYAGKKYFVISRLKSFGTLRDGPMIVFGLMFSFFFVAAAILGFISWRRQKPTSPFHPKKLNEILEQTN